MALTKLTSVDKSVAKKLLSELPIQVSTVAEMETKSYAVGQVVETVGYYAEGDSGAARYLVKAAQTFDGYGDHELANGNIAVLQINETMSTKQFGVLHDTSEQTAALQAALDRMAGLGELVSSWGQVGVDPLTNISIPSSTRLRFEYGSSWKAINPTNATSYIIMDIRDVQNVMIWNPVLIGDKDEHSGDAVSSLTSVGSTATITTLLPHGLSGTILGQVEGANQTEYNGQHVLTVTGPSTITYPFAGSGTSPATGSVLLFHGEQGHCLNVSSNGTTSNIHIYNPICTKAWGDGIVIRNGNIIHFYNATCVEARRNGITINKGRNIYFHGDTRVTNTNGTSPEAGLDIEPNNNSGELSNIIFDNLVTKNNIGPGMTLNTGDFPSGGIDKNFLITIHRHEDNGSVYGLNIEKMAGSATEKISGSVVFGEQTYSNSKSCGVYFNDYTGSNSATIHMPNLTIIDPNSNGSTSSLFGAGIGIDRKVSSSLTNSIGNCIITNPIIKDTRAVTKMTRGITAIDNSVAGGALLENFKIIDPIEISGYSAIGDAVFINMKGMELTDKYNQSARQLVGSLSVTSRGYRKLFSVSAVMFTVTDGITRDNAGMPLTVEALGVGTSGIRFNPKAARSVYPLSTVAGKYVQSTDRGARLTLSLDTDEDTWYVVEQIGNWTVEA